MAQKSPQREEVKAMVREALAGRVEAATVDESIKTVITELDVREVPEGGELVIGEGAIVTPSARDLIQERGIRLSHRARSSGSQAVRRMIGVGSDHGGFEMKEELKRLLADLGYRFRDFGTSSTEAVDYPDFAHAVARAVADGGCDLGIIVDGAGIGSSIAANKVPGVRAALCYDEATARNSREHNYANVLTLGAKMISAEKMREIVKAWLTTSEGEDRHRKRVEKITAIERQYLR